MNMEKWLTEFVDNKDPDSFDDVENHLYMSRIEGGYASIKSTIVDSELQFDKNTLDDSIGRNPNSQKLKNLCVEIKNKLALPGKYEIEPNGTNLILKS